MGFFGKWLERFALRCAQVGEVAGLHLEEHLRVRKKSWLRLLGLQAPVASVFGGPL